jgi:hypothetical protein
MSQFSADFFEPLTERQMAMLRVLLDHGGAMQREQICEEMRDTYGVTISDDGLNGVIAGITKLHGEEATESVFSQREKVDLGFAQTTLYTLSRECKKNLAEYVVEELGIKIPRYEFQYK